MLQTEIKMMARVCGLGNSSNDNETIIIRNVIGFCFGGLQDPFER